MAESLKSKTVHGVIWSSVERFSTQGVSFVFGLIMARLLSPHDYGVIAMLAIFMAISQSFIDSGFSNALIRKPDRTETDNSTVFYFNIVVGLIAYLILFVLSPYIADFYKTPILSPITKVIAISLFLNSLCVVQQAILTIKIDFKTQAKISLSAAIFSGFIGIALAYRGFGVWALAVQSVSASAVRMILLWALSKWRPKKPFSKKSFKELFSYGSKLLASGLLDTTYNNMYTIIIGKLFSAANLGLYSRAQQFAMFPSSNITGILQRVTFPILSTIQNEDQRLRENYRKLLKMSAFIVFPLMAGLAAVADPLIRLLLTDKWAGAIIFLQIICFAEMWYPIHAINLNLLQVKGRSDLFLKLEIVKKVLGVTILCITIPMGLLVMCFGQVFSSLIALFINTYYTGKLINIGYVRQMKDLLPILINSLVMSIIAYLITLLFSNNFLRVLLAITGGGSYFILSSYLFKVPELLFLVKIIQKK